MIKKRTVIILIIILILVSVSIAIIRATRVLYLDIPLLGTSISDAEYLNVSDLRKLYIFVDRDEKEYLENLTKDMIIDSYNNNGINDSYSDIISDVFFERLNPNQTNNNEFNFELNSVDVYCLCNEDKAIVFFYKECSMQSDSNTIKCNITTKKYPFERLYFEKNDGKWKAVSLTIPA